MRRLVEIRSYRLKPGSEAEFHDAIVNRGLPLVRTAGMDVVAFGFSAEDHAPLTVNASAASMGAREGKAAAIVGAAVVVIGLVVGGDSGTVIAIGGAGLGLFGLYIWQRGD